MRERQRVQLILGAALVPDAFLVPDTVFQQTPYLFLEAT